MTTNIAIYHSIYGITLLYIILLNGVLLTKVYLDLELFEQVKLAQHKRAASELSKGGIGKDCSRSATEAKAHYAYVTHCLVAEFLVLFDVCGIMIRSYGIARDRQG